jgi:RNA polymerase sigma-70 factor, ECF subfamily
LKSVATHCVPGLPRKTDTRTRRLPEHKSESPFSGELERVRAAVDGDESAYAAIVAEHQPAITRLMWRFTRDPRKLEELVHDAFVEVYFSLAKYRGTGPLGGWIRTIAVRVGYKFWKEKKKDSEHQSLNEEIATTPALLSPSNEVPEDPEEAHRALYDALALLAPRDRLVLTLLYWESCTTEEAAVLTGWSGSMVRVQAYRARKRLKKVLEARDYGTV